MRSSLIAVVTLFIGIAIALPVRDNDVDELVLHVNELRRQNSDGSHAIVKRHIDPIGGGYVLRSSPEGYNQRAEILAKLGNVADMILGKNPDSYNKKFDFMEYVDAPRAYRNYENLPIARRALDSIGGGHLIKRTLDSIGGANLLKK